VGRLLEHRRDRTAELEAERAAVAARRARPDGKVEDKVDPGLAGSDCVSGSFAAGEIVEAQGSHGHSGAVRPLAGRPRASLMAAGANGNIARSSQFACALNALAGKSAARSNWGL
jgi:hypothetical protein